MSLFSADGSLNDLGVGMVTEEIEEEEEEQEEEIEAAFAEEQ